MAEGKSEIPGGQSKGPSPPPVAQKLQEVRAGVGVQVPTDRLPLRGLGLIGTGSDSGEGLSGDHRQQLSTVTARAGAGSDTTGRPGKATMRVS